MCKRRIKEGRPEGRNIFMRRPAKQWKSWSQFLFGGCCLCDMWLLWARWLEFLENVFLKAARKALAKHNTVGINFATAAF